MKIFSKSLTILNFLLFLGKCLAQKSETVIVSVQPNIIDTKNNTSFVEFSKDSTPTTGIKKSIINVYNEKTLNGDLLPIYDINTLPISVWFFKDGDKNVGFMVAGHAYKEVCEISSREVIQEIEKIGRIDTTIFTYGVGFDIRPKTSGLWNTKYDSLLNIMRIKFIKIASDNPEQVIVNDISYAQYLQKQNNIKAHINWANKTKSWNNYIIEHKYSDSPLIVPFYDLKTQMPIVFKIPKEDFGTTLTEFADNNDIKSLIDKQIMVLNLGNKNNAKELYKLSNQRIEDRAEFIYSFGFIYPIFEYTKKEGGKLKKMFLESYESGPAGKLTRKLNGIVIEERMITFQETKKLLNDGQTSIEASFRREINDYIKKEPMYQKKFLDNKKLLMIEIQNITNNNLKEIESLKKLKIEIKNSNKDNFIIIDAFLRGWAFSSESDVSNAKLDKWYDDYRPKVWNKILEKYPNAKQDQKMAGIFHSDDVFFQVALKGGIFNITPYKVVGGDFVQVINKSTGICTFYTSFNFRHNEE